MKRLLLILALASAACAPTAPPQPARIEDLVNPPQGVDAALCTADGAWCAKKTPEVDGYIFSFHNQPIWTWRSAADTRQDLWTRVIRMPRSNGGEDILVGITNTDQQSYSGGGGEAVQVSLLPLSSTTPASAAPQSVLTFPASAALDIRACFSEADTRARRDACSDQYNFTGTLTLEASAPARPPRLILATEATTFPGVRTRSSDSTQEPPLDPDDLKTVRDETCSYRRVFTRGADGLYTPDQPLPACEDYLQP